MDWLFAQEQFDERDLVKVDKEVMDRYLELTDPKNYKKIMQSMSEVQNEYSGDGKPEMRVAGAGI